MDHFWWKTTNLGDGESAIKCAGQHDTLNSPCWQGTLPYAYSLFSYKEENTNKNQGKKISSLIWTTLHESASYKG
jgi:hypothetical protein